MGIGAFVNPVLALAAVGVGWMLVKAHEQTSAAVHPTLQPEQQTTLDKVASKGKAAPAARDLYGYLKANGNGGSPTLVTLVTAFQAASNTDADAVTLAGPMPVTGIYDQVTSAALTMYTKDPIPASPSAPREMQPPPKTPPAQLNFSVPGSAARAGSNLYVYLKAHGCDGSMTLAALVKEFQLSVNEDPKFPGPAGTAPILVRSALRTDGVFDKWTAGALSIGAGETLKACG